MSPAGGVQTEERPPGLFQLQGHANVPSASEPSMGGLRVKRKVTVFIAFYLAWTAKQHDYRHMTKNHYIREWRKFRGLTMEQLGDQAGMSMAAIARVERGDQRYNQDVLEALAKVLACTVADLIMRDPAIGPDHIGEIWATLEPDQRGAVLELVKAFTKGRAPAKIDGEISAEVRRRKYSDEAAWHEQALLGAILYDNTAYDRLREQVQPYHFSDPLHQRLFEAMRETICAGLLADPILLAEKFEDDRALKELGGVRYLATLVDHAPPAASAPDHAASIVAAYMRHGRAGDL